MNEDTEVRESCSNCIHAKPTALVKMIRCWEGASDNFDTLVHEDNRCPFFAQKVCGCEKVKYIRKTISKNCLPKDGE